MMWKKLKIKFKHIMSKDEKELSMDDIKDENFKTDGYGNPIPTSHGVSGISEENWTPSKRVENVPKMEAETKTDEFSSKPSNKNFLDFVDKENMFLDVDVSQIEVKTYPKEIISAILKKASPEAISSLKKEICEDILKSLEESVPTILSAVINNIGKDD